MDWIFDAIRGGVSGVVQGLTEFLPVSSSGHLILVPKLFGWQDQGLAFDTVLHWGTLAALLIYFRRNLATYATSAVQRGPSGKRTRTFLWLCALASVPALALGLLVGDLIDAHARNVPLVAIDLAFWGLVLLYADHHSRVQNKAEDDEDAIQDISWKQALAVGIAQPIAMLPGTSRSGITMTAGLLVGLSRSSAARFSFLLSIVSTGAAGSYGMLKLVKQGVSFDGGVALLAGFAAAFLSGWLAIRFLMNYVAKHHLDIFAYYRLALALLLLVLM